MTNPKEKMKERLRRKKHKQKLHLKELLALLNAENTVDVNDLYKTIERKDKKKEELNADIKEENTCNKDTDLFSEQFALLIIAALGFIVAYTWNTFLNRCIENHVKNHILQHFIYVIGITIIATIIIYFIGKYLEI